VVKVLKLKVLLEFLKKHFSTARAFSLPFFKEKEIKEKRRKNKKIRFKKSKASLTAQGSHSIYTF
jgi:hypothetical protein